MAQYGRPVADIAVGSWTTSPLWDKLDEVSADDATTEITTGNNPSNVTGEVRLGPVTDPDLDTGHVLRIRAYTTNNCTLAWALYQGTTLIANCGTITLGGSYATTTYTLTEAEAAAITNYSDLRIRFIGNGSGRARVTWIEAQFPDQLIQKSGEATISGGKTISAAIRKAALVAAVIGVLGHVAATGVKAYPLLLHGGGTVAVAGTKGVGLSVSSQDDFNAYLHGSPPPNPPWLPAMGEMTVYDWQLGGRWGYTRYMVRDLRIPAMRNQKVTVRFVANHSDTRLLLELRVNDGTGTKYQAWLGTTNGYGLTVFKYTPTQELLVQTYAFWATPNDLVTFEVVGDALRFYINGILKWSAIDTSVAFGEMAIGFYTGVNYARGIDDYSARVWSDEGTVAISGSGTAFATGMKGAFNQNFVTHAIDTFHRQAEGSFLGDDLDWSSGGSIKVKSGGIYCEVFGNGSNLYLGESVPPADYFVQATVRGEGDNAFCGLTIREHYTCWFRDGFGDIVLWRDGTLIEQYPYPTFQVGDTIALSVSGTTITALVNGVPIRSWVDGTYSLGRAGVILQGPSSGGAPVQMDDFIIGYNRGILVSGKGNIYVWSEDKTGALAIHGNGQITVGRQKGGLASLVQTAAYSWTGSKNLDEPPWAYPAGAHQSRLRHVSSNVYTPGYVTCFAHHTGMLARDGYVEATFYNDWGSGFGGTWLVFRSANGKAIRFGYYYYGYRVQLDWVQNIETMTGLSAQYAIGDWGLYKPAGSSVRARLEISGNNYKIFIDGALFAQGSYAFHNEAGCAGIAAYHSPSPPTQISWTAGSVVNGTILFGGGRSTAGGWKAARTTTDGVFQDDFNRPDEDPIDPTKWDATSYPCTVSGQKMLGPSNGYPADAYAKKLFASGRSGQYAEAEVWDNNGILRIHSTGAEVSGYRANFMLSQNRIVLERGLPGGGGAGWTILAPDVFPSPPIAAGGRGRLGRYGDNIRVYWNSVLMMDVADTAQMGGTRIGVALQRTGGVIDDFKAGDLSAVVLSGGGVVGIIGQKTPRFDVSISGGGTVTASTREDARYPAAISGGGTITLAGKKGAKRAVPISGGGTIAADGRIGGQKHAQVSGGGTIEATGDSAFIDTASVFALIHGGGSITSNGNRQTEGEASLYGGGRVSVSYDRSWEVIPFQKIDSPDSVCYLIKMEMDYCSRTFGVSPCVAAGTRCYNTWKTCKYIVAYLATKKIYRYVSANFPQAFPDARPYIADVKYMPTEIKTNLTVNARVSFSMLDEPDADVDTDPYWSTRSSHPGTYWKRWLARNANYKDRIVRIYEGVYGRPESTYVQKWTGRLENIKIKGDKFTFEAVDLLKDLAKIEVPPKTNAKLALALAANAGQTFTITEDADKFPASGYVRIEDEIIRYTALDVSTKTFTIGGISNRAQFGTVATAHAQNGKVQQAKFYAAKNPLEILLDMLLGDAGMVDSWVETANVNNVNAAFTTTSAYVELGVAVSQSWPSVGIMKLENWSTPGVIEYVRYTSKTYVPGGVGVSPAWRFNFETYSGVMTGRALFGTPRISGGVNSIRAEIGYFEYVDTDAFYQYRDWPARDIDFTSIISEPTKLSDLYMEIVDLLDAKSWVAENLKITIRKNTTNTPTTGYVSLSDADNIIEDSGSVDVNEKSRISRMTVYWDKVATGKASEEISYRRLDIAIDPDAETNYGDPVEKVVKSRWIDPYVTLEETVQQFVKNLAIRRIQRCKHAQNLITVKVPEKDAGVKTGDYVRLSTDELLESDGNPISARMYQVVKRERSDKAVTLTFIQVTPRRMAVIAPAGLPAYPSATEVQRAYGYICDATGKMSDGTDGYFIW